MNANLVSALLAAGVNAFGCHGICGRLIRAAKQPPRVVFSAGPEPIDFDEVTSVNADFLQDLLNLQRAPVIATLDTNAQGRIFHLTADTTIVQVVNALRAIFVDYDDGGGRHFSRFKGTAIAKQRN